jgi:Na+-translocating ferredoxin:NAD+ oxidoreductase RNF subunit RnfB
MSMKKYYQSCIDCSKCIEACPIDAISGENDMVVIDKDICLGCLKITTNKTGSGQ